jgi:Histidine phosphatase superfamily (branch 2)
MASRRRIHYCSLRCLLLHVRSRVYYIVLSTTESEPLIPDRNMRPLGNSQSIADQVGSPADIRVSRSWGQYSPYFDVPSDISIEIPKTCYYTFAQLLARHGSRFPTAFKSSSYRLLIDRIQADVDPFEGPCSFLKDYKYELGAEQLTAFGEHELFVSGGAFYARYETLTRDQLPFIRASGSDRVVKSAEKFSAGYHEAHRADKSGSTSLPSPSVAVVISEEDGSNNTLCIKSCPAFSAKPNIDVGIDSKATWAALFVPALQDRLNEDMVGANLTIDETIDLMDLCPFETVASSDVSSLSPFCGLFTLDEWKKYEYYQSLDKYYGHGMGNPLAPSLGVGFVNELIARLTHSPVQDETCTNRTLDSSNSTFPLEPTLYADFSHDNDMEKIFAALGLYNATKQLPLTSIQDAEQSQGFSAAWTVPFGARMYVEKMKCAADDDEYVRILVNNRVIPLDTCTADEFGRCKLDDFVKSLSFARDGGNWDRCYIS